MELIDSHLHFDTFDQAGDVEQVVERAVAGGVRRMVAIGGSDSSNQLAVELTSRYPECIYAVVGYDRHLAASAPPVQPVKALAGMPGVVGIGETGLDYHYDAASAEVQRTLFGAMMDVAADVQRPLVIHCRKAESDALRMLEQHRVRWTGDAGRLGVLHCFTGSAAFAAELLQLGLYLSFSGIVTFRNAAALRRTAETIPDDRLLVETDAPYLAPPPHRGKRNEPAYVALVAAALAEVRGTTPEALAEQTTRNACRLFGINREVS